MKFIDEARIEVHAGKGGDGVASFRREKFVPRGGPDGGDGGRGGSIFAVADRNINTLIDYRYARIHRAKNGQKGMGSDCYGRAAEDIVRLVHHITEFSLAALKDIAQKRQAPIHESR